MSAPSSHGYGWTSERVGQLIELWTAGLSASQIATRLTGVSRNAVIGKVHRLGLVGREAPYKPGKPAGRPNALRQTVARTPRSLKVAKAVAPVRSARGKNLPTPTPPLPPRPIQAGTQPRHWLTRQAGECAYPAAGDGADTLSCCAPTSEGFAYCSAHHKLTHAPPPTDAQRAAAARARAAKAHAMKPSTKARAA